MIKIKPHDHDINYWQIDIPWTHPTGRSFNKRYYTLDNLKFFAEGYQTAIIDRVSDVLEHVEQPLQNFILDSVRRNLAIDIDPEEEVQNKGESLGIYHITKADYHAVVVAYNGGAAVQMAAENDMDKPEGYTCKYIGIAQSMPGEERIITSHWSGNE
jgi:hypothetical protein